MQEAYSLKNKGYLAVFSVLIVATVSRTIYLSYNQDEFKGHPDKKRLDWRFPVMQIAIINKWMLFWPLALIVSCLVPIITTHEIWTYVRQVITKWILSYALFMIFYLGFGYVSGTKEADFDPSGHMACALAAQLNYFATYLFFV